MSMSSRRQGGTKLLYHAERGKMKGDAVVWSASHFQINVRRATAGASPFATKCKTHLYYACHARFCKQNHVLIAYVPRIIYSTHTDIKYSHIAKYYE
jgi:hypothetical protein